MQYLEVGDDVNGSSWVMVTIIPSSYALWGAVCAPELGQVQQG